METIDLTGPATEERRVHPRFPILIKGIAEPIGVPGSGGLDVVASDVSLGGILLHTNRGEALREGDVLALTFTPLLDGEPLKLQVCVIWLRPAMAPRLGSCTVGASFFHSSDAEVRRLLDAARLADALKLIVEPY